MKSGAMICTLEVNCATIRDCFQDTGKAAAETGTDEMVMGAAWALCEFSRFVSQQTYSEVSLAEEDNGLKRFENKNSGFRHQKMSKSAKAKVDELLAIKNHRLGERKIHKIRTAMEVKLCRTAKIAT
jgi:hypothetical protein